MTETRDCGTLTLRWGVTAGNTLSIADGFAPGTTWNLEVGAGSYQLHPLLNDIRQTVCRGATGTGGRQPFGRSS